MNAGSTETAYVPAPASTHEQSIGRCSRLLEVLRRRQRHDIFPAMKWISLVADLTASAVLQPLLAWDLLRVAWRFRHREWYKRFPFLPVPSMAYLRWRMYTAYGDENYLPPKADIVAYARWLRHQP